MKVMTNRLLRQHWIFVFAAVFVFAAAWPGPICGAQPSSLPHLRKQGAATQLIAILLCLAFVAGAARAQVLYGSVIGSVTDAAGSGVSGATVRLTNTGQFCNHHQRDWRRQRRR
jgi:hypothetical protein